MILSQTSCHQHLGLCLCALWMCATSVSGLISLSLHKRGRNGVAPVVIMGSSVPVKGLGSRDEAQACFTLTSESSSNSLLSFLKKIIILLLSLKYKVLPLVSCSVVAEILTRQPRKLRDRSDTQLKFFSELTWQFDSFVNFPVSLWQKRLNVVVDL